jgi:hypothetical protein
LFHHGRVAREQCWHGALVDVISVHAARRSIHPAKRN